MPDQDAELKRQASHLTTASLARLFRLITALQKKQCPTDQYGNCYWCRAPILFQRRYVGDVRGTHYAGCPWQEVLDYQSLREYLEAGDVPGAEAVEQPEPTESAPPAEPAAAGDGDDPADRPVRAADEKGTSDA